MNPKKKLSKVQFGINPNSKFDEKKLPTFVLEMEKDKKALQDGTLLAHVVALKKTKACSFFIHACTKKGKLFLEVGYSDKNENSCGSSIEGVFHKIEIKT